MNTTSSSANTGYGGAYNTYNTSTTKKNKPYRNRPSKRQALLELLSFLLLFAGAPAFLGGAFAIFICIFALITGLIGLFAWTRRHAFIFALLSFLLIAACIVNIILRAAPFDAQCLPFYRYSGAFNGGAGGAGTFNPNADFNSDDSNNYDQSIWCGNRYIVYITHGVIIAIAIPALLIALSLLFRRKRNTNNVSGGTVRTTETKTRTVATA